MRKIALNTLDIHLQESHDVVRKGVPYNRPETPSSRAGSASLLERDWNDVYDQGMVYSGGLPGLGRRR